MTWVRTLAQAPVDESKVTPGVLGFTVVALIGLATYLLVRSMNRRIKRIDLPQEDLPQHSGVEETPPPGDPVSGGPDRP